MNTERECMVFGNRIAWFCLIALASVQAQDKVSLVDGNVLLGRVVASTCSDPPQLSFQAKRGSASLTFGLSEIAKLEMGSYVLDSSNQTKPDAAQETLSPGDGDELAGEILMFRDAAGHRHVLSQLRQTHAIGRSD